MTATPTLDSIVLALQLAGLEQRLSQVIDQILSFLPVILSAIVILAVGLVVGRLLEAIVVRVLQGIGLSDYTGGTALETSGEEGGLEHALGKGRCLLRLHHCDPRRRRRTSDPGALGPACTD